MIINLIYECSVLNSIIQSNIIILITLKSISVNVQFKYNNTFIKLGEFLWI